MCSTFPFFKKKKINSKSKVPNQNYGCKHLKKICQLNEDFIEANRLNSTVSNQRKYSRNILKMLNPIFFFKYACGLEI